MWCRKRQWKDPSVAYGDSSPYRGAKARIPEVSPSRGDFFVPLKGGMGGGQRAEGLMQQREPLRFGKGRTTSPYRGGLGGRIV